MKNNKLKATIRTSEGYETIEIDQLTESMDIVKIGNKHMKPYVYVREFDFTNLSDADKIGFRDDFIYDYLKDNNEDVLKLTNVSHRECLELFKEYESKKGTIY